MCLTPVWFVLQQWGLSGRFSKAGSPCCYLPFPTIFISFFYPWQHLFFFSSLNTLGEQVNKRWNKGGWGQVVFLSHCGVAGAEGEGERETGCWGTFGLWRLHSGAQRPGSRRTRRKAKEEMLKVGRIDRLDAIPSESPSHHPPPSLPWVFPNSTHIFQKSERDSERHRERE